MFSEEAAFKPRARFGPIEPELAFNSNDYYPDMGTPRTKELLPSSLARSPPYNHRSSIPPRDRLGKPNRPRKLSVSQNARKPKHERTKSKEHARRNSYDRKQLSVEPGSMANKFGSRWEDLIEAAASATEEDSRDLTPVCDLDPQPPPLWFRREILRHIVWQTDAPVSEAKQSELAPSTHASPPLPRKHDAHVYRFSPSASTNSTTSRHGRSPTLSLRRIRRLQHCEQAVRHQLSHVFAGLVDVK